MTQYIDKAAVVAEIERRLKDQNKYRDFNYLQIKELEALLSFLDTLEVKEGKQIIIITESDGDAHIHCDCRSLEDVNTLLDCAKSVIIDRQTENVRGKGSFPDYNTEEGRYKDLFAKSSEVKEVDLELELNNFIEQQKAFVKDDRVVEYNNGDTFNHIYDLEDIAKHFFELGIKVRKGE